MQVAERIGRRLKQLREERGWTQQTLAGKAGVSQSTIAGVETSAQLPGATLLGRLSELFRVNLDFFYREKENPFGMLLRAGDVKAEDVATLRTIEERCLRYRQIEKMAKEEVKPTPQYQPPANGAHVVSYAEKVAEQERLRLDVGFDALTDLPRVLEDEGIRVLGLDSKSELDGLFVYSDEDGAFVLVNTRDRSSARQLFTLAHEYCHVLLHRGMGARLDYNTSSAPKKGDLVEMAAGAFAAAFLMPDFKIREAWSGRYGGRASRLIWLKRSFGVSYRALGWRLLNLGLISKSERETIESEEDDLKATEQLLYGDDLQTCLSIPAFSDRLRLLAMRAYLFGDVTVTKFAEWLEVDVVTADEIAKALEYDKGLRNVPAAG